MPAVLSLCLMALAGLGQVATANPVNHEIVTARADATPTTTSSTTATTTRRIPTNANPTNIMSPYGGFHFYQYGGSCVKPPKSGVPLEHHFVDRRQMSIQKCLGRARGYRLAALRNGTDCWYGDAPGYEPKNDMSVIHGLQNCMVPCSGDPLVACGGKDELILLYEPDSAGSPDFAASVTAGSKTYKNPACYFHTEGTPALEHVTTTSTMTVEECAGLAAAQNATYAGIEDGNQCWYGDVPSAGLTYEPTLNNCIWTKCAGNPSQYCGSVSRILMYQWA